MKPIKVLLLGAGGRGMDAYAAYALRNPTMMKIAAVAEPNDVKRTKIQQEHNVPAEMLFNTWEAAFEKKLDVDGVIIATQDKMHLDPLTKAMEYNYHILCEKPIVPTLEECKAIEKKAVGFNKVFIIAHVLRYTNFFSRLKDLIQSGQIGKLVGIDLIENVGHIHMSHSFVRGNWRNFAESSPMILAKSCHDMDMLLWLADSDCESLNSYGSLSYFKKENAPKDAPKRCLDGCPHIDDCPYHVQKIYLTDNVAWPVNIITTDLSLQGRIKVLETGPYGRCVFQCDNDVVDHQVVSMRFKNGVFATFTMSAFTMTTHRNLKLLGTHGEVVADMEDNTIKLYNFVTKEVQTIDLTRSVPASGHSGGDDNLVSDFVRLIRDKNGTGRTTVQESIQSHFMAFAAENSRLHNGTAINIAQFRT